MKHPLFSTALVLLALFSPCARAADAAKPKLYLIGGSTMASYPPTRPIVGWGQMLPRFFQDPAQVDNRALSGRSSKSFIEQGHWEKVITDLRAGDFLLICFGTNDGKKEDPARFTEPRGTFLANLRRFVRETRAHGATPILATTVAHRRWDEQGHFVDPPLEYDVVTRELAAEERVPLLEMNARTVALERSLGPEGSRALHLHLPPGKSASYPDGVKDDTHYCAFGARRVAELAVQEIRRLELPLVAWLQPTTEENKR
jgi:lysophospholipase L1-like esterase